MTRRTQFRNCEYNPHSQFRERSKQQQREWVQAHFFSFHPPGTRKLACFSLPGIKWKLEEKLLEAYPGLVVVGVERDRELALQSRWRIPARGAAELHIAPAHEYLLGPSTQRFDMVWLDQTGSCNRELFDAMRGLAGRLSTRPVPFVVTLFPGRERPVDLARINLLGGPRKPAAERRANALRVSLRTHSGRITRITECRHCLTPSGVSMMLIFGVVTTTPCPLSHPHGEADVQQQDLRPVGRRRRREGRSHPRAGDPPR